MYIELKNTDDGIQADIIEDRSDLPQVFDANLEVDIGSTLANRYPVVKTFSASTVNDVLEQVDAALGLDNIVGMIQGRALGFPNETTTLITALPKFFPNVYKAA